MSDVADQERWDKEFEAELREQIAREIEAYVFEGYSTNYSAVTHTIEQAARIARKDLPPARLPDGHQPVTTETRRSY